jgi:hypothetical protein
MATTIVFVMRSRRAHAVEGHAKSVCEAPRRTRETRVNASARARDADSSMRER